LEKRPGLETLTVKQQMLKHCSGKKQIPDWFTRKHIIRSCLLAHISDKLTAD